MYTHMHCFIVLLDEVTEREPDEHSLVRRAREKPAKL